MTKPMYTPQTRNITGAFRLLWTMRDTDDSITVGSTWYDRAREFARTLDPANVDRAAGIIAALSPMNSWPVNMRLAQNIYAGIDFGYLSTGKTAAHRIFAGESPSDVLKGPKVSAFYANIMGHDTVTIDRHAVDVACGRVCTDKVRGHWASPAKGRYAFTVDKFVRATDIINREFNTEFSPAQIQAITWVWWRRYRAQNNHGGDEF